MTCGAETEANTVMATLLTGVDFTIPTVDLTDPDFSIPAGPAIALPAQPTNADLTAATLEGSGTFDTIMRAINAHLKNEFDKSRITGAEYAKVYLGSMEAALGNAVQFLLQRDQSYWTAVRAQYEAKIAEAKLVQARVELATSKVNLAAIQYQARVQEATYALTKMKLSTESIAYCTAKYNLDNILPQQLRLVTEQADGAVIANDTASYNLVNILPAQKLVLDDQHNQNVYTLANMLPAQKTLVTEQAEAQRAQTLDTRLDGVTPVVGVLGKQKDLYSQQITSYKRDAEMKAAKLFTDAWITMKTIDEGLLPPDNFNNTSLNAILGTLKTNNLLG